MSHFALCEVSNYPKQAVIPSTVLYLSRVESRKSPRRCYQHKTAKRPHNKDYLYKSNRCGCFESPPLRYFFVPRGLTGYRSFTIRLLNTFVSCFQRSHRPLKSYSHALISACCKWMGPGCRIRLNYQELNTETGCCNSRFKKPDELSPKGSFAPKLRRPRRCLVYLWTLRLSTEVGGGAHETSYLNPVIHTYPILFHAAERSYCV